MQEFNAIDDRIESLSVLSCAPIILNDWVLEVAEVPKLDTLTKCATTRHHILVVVTDINSVTAD